MPFRDRVPKPKFLLPFFSVVIIDDSQEDRYVLSRMLRRNKLGVEFEIREADTGARGVELCRSRTPDCLLLDYNLNDTNGIDLLAELNEGRDADVDPLCPVVILTGAGMIAQIAVRALNGGAQDYLTKEGLTADGLVLSIENAVEKVWLRRVMFESEARFRLSLDNMLDSFGIYEAMRDERSGEIVDFECTYVNLAARRGSENMSKEHVGQLLVSQTLSTCCSGRLYDEYLEVVKTGVPVNRTDQTYTRDGMNLQGAFDIRVWKMGDGFAAAWRDVTAQNRAEEKLRKVERRLEANRADVAKKQQEVSEIVQHSLLLAPAPDAYPGVTVQLFYRSAVDEALIGGDFFDAFPVAENVVALVVGDATGKGVESASYTAEVKFTLRAFLCEHRNLLIAVNLLNRYMVSNSSSRQDGPGYYVALSAVLMDTSTGEVSSCCAGAEPPLLLKRETAELIPLCEYGPLLGVSSDSEFTVERNLLEVDDLIAMTTDGITETRHPFSWRANGERTGGEFFGIEGMERVLREEAAGESRDLQEIQEAMMKRIMEWSGGVQNDDICLLLARRRSR